MKELEKKAGQIFLMNYDFIIRLAFHFAPWPDLSEDIAHQVFVEFMSHPSRWNLDGDVKPLLIKMTRDVAYRFTKERCKQQTEVQNRIVEHLRQVAEQSLDKRMNRDDIFFLRECVNRLPAKSRRLIERYYHEGISIVQIAQGMNSKDSRIRQILCRLRLKLRQCVERLIRERNGELQ